MVDNGRARPLAHFRNCRWESVSAPNSNGLARFLASHPAVRFASTSLHAWWDRDVQGEGWPVESLLTSDQGTAHPFSGWRLRQQHVVKTRCEARQPTSDTRRHRAWNGMLHTANNMGVTCFQSSRSCRSRTIPCPGSSLIWGSSFGGRLETRTRDVRVQCPTLGACGRRECPVQPQCVPHTTQRHSGQNGRTCRGVLVGCPHLGVVSQKKSICLASCRSSSQGVLLTGILGLCPPECHVHMFRTENVCQLRRFGCRDGS